MKISQGLAPGTYLHDGTYRIEKELGQGSFGITYLASAKVTTPGKVNMEVRVAIKEFFMGEVNSRHEGTPAVEGSAGSVFTHYRKKFRKEAENLTKLSNNNIVKVFDVFDENDTTYYVMEYLEGVNLDEYIRQKGRIPESEALKILREIGGALSYMHSEKILHLDIKPKNVMHKLDGKNYLIDFGLSKQYTATGEPESSTSIGLGTPGYVPIEQSQYKQDGTFPATLDVYALGATLFKMLTGQRPPEAPILLNDGFPYDELSGAGVSKPTVDALAKAMNPIKRERFQTVDEFLAQLKPARKRKTATTPEVDDEATTFTSEETVFTGSESAAKAASEKPKTANKHKTAGTTPGASKAEVNPPAAGSYAPQNQSTQAAPQKPGKNKLIKIDSKIPYIILAIGVLLLIIMGSKHDGSLDRLDADGKQLAYLFAIMSGCGAWYLFKKNFKLRNVWFKWRWILLSLFLANTLFIVPNLNYSLTGAYIILSIGLLANTFIMFRYRPPVS